MNVQHVPAWKRLGLKLKYANESAPPTTTTSRVHDSGGKRKQEDIPHDASGWVDQHQPKKARISVETPRKKLNKSSLPMTTSGDIEDHDKKRKKSVTFTPDTKVEDGDTAQAIQSWHPDSPGSTPKKAVNGDDTAKSTALPKQSKREKKPKNQRERSDPAPPRKATAALDYLDQFHHHHASWKFNKNHETWILKHALSAEHIPQQQSLALASYLRGLKSIGAKERLVDQSRETLKASNALDQNSSLLQDRLTKALEVSYDDGDGSQGQPPWLNDLSRGVLILLSLDEGLQEEETQAQPNTRSVSRAKKNKSRTSRIEVDYSSSSEDESDSDSEMSNSATRAMLMNGKDVKDTEETSSSGTSSDSTSTEESDSEDGDTSSED